MSASPAVFAWPNTPSRTAASPRNNRLLVKPFLAGGSGRRSSLCGAFLRNSIQIDRRFGIESFRTKTVMEWQDCRAVVEVEVPCSVAYDYYSEREAIPRWMPMISSVKVLKDKPHLSEWTLSYEYFGRDYTFSWLAHNLQPMPNQKIHWRSLGGTPNRGAVRFFPRSISSCTVELTVSYEVPVVLSPFTSALRPFVESFLQRGLDRFATYVKEDYAAYSQNV
ncbi:uncharacterized protein LOC116266911 [Nymphaea colorata]|nr:uncharacterized protein LOC116266911 [Nymphaea colorata]XP_049937180.1 uncharacterized protein LOC116266911 [Nymphaea colorata]